MVRGIDNKECAMRDVLDGRLGVRINRDENGDIVTFIEEFGLVTPMMP